ncbi:MAG: aquaporin [Candidatus Nitrosocosmicus sp.]
MFKEGTTTLVKIVRENLSSNQKKFIAEVIGTFLVVVLATGSVVIDAKMNGILGIPFIAFAPFVGVAIGVYLFGRISMAHFNPAVTLGFLMLCCMIPLSQIHLANINQQII